VAHMCGSFFCLKILDNSLAGNITALKVQKKDKSRVNVYLDGEYAFAVTVNVALNLKKGQYLTDAEINQFQVDDAVHKAYQRAIRYLGYRPRTKREVQQYLIGKDIPEAVVELVIEQLIEREYVDDAAFGQIWVESRTNHNPKGARALRHELRQKGLKTSDIDHALEDLDEESLAWQAVQKKLKSWKRLDELTLKRKLTSYLSYRGFGYDIIGQIYSRIWEDREENDEKGNK